MMKPKGERTEKGTLLEDVLEKAVLIVDLRRTIVYANPLASLLFGYEQDELHGQDLSLVDMDDSWKFATSKRWMAANGIQKDSLTSFPVKVRIQALHDLEGSQIATIYLIEDCRLHKSGSERFEPDFGYRQSQPLLRVL